MNIEVIRTHNNLRRELWRFNLMVSPGRSTIYFDGWFEQEKKSTRHKWATLNHWSRHMRRDSTTDTPPLPNDVKEEARRISATKVSLLNVET